jgi:hypothetical protein
LGDTAYYSNEFWKYRTLAIGISYILLGYSFSQSERKVLSGVLYSFGVIGFLGSAIALQGYKPTQNYFWELIFPVLNMVIILISVKLRSKSFLVFGSLFLIGYIIKITSEYFSDSLGWPVALVIAGFGIMGVGYLIVWIRKKYFIVSPPAPVPMV